MHVQLKVLIALALVALPQVGAAQVRGNVYLKTVRVTAIPGPPSGDWWDGDVIRNLGGTLGPIFAGRSPNLYPDIELCIGSRAGCRLVCVNAQLNADDPALRPLCGLQLDTGLRVAELVEVQGQRQWRPRELEFEVNDIDENGSTANRRTMGRLMLYAGAQPPILQPDRCSESEPCIRTVQTERGPLELSFTTVFAGVVGTLPPPTLPGAPDAPAAPGQPTAPSTTNTPSPSYWQQFKDWMDDFLWDQAKEPAGWRGTVLEGLADQAKVAEDKYAECLVEAVKDYKLESRLESSCKGKTGDEAKSCAYNVVGEQSLAKAQICQSNERTYGFLANMYKSVCAFVGMVCN
jgi:hypothetical protein